MKIKVLGSGGWIPTEMRNTCSYIIKEDNEVLFLDLGSGISNFDMYKRYIDNVSDFNILLSHYHLDHIIGLIYLLKICRKKNINIWGPGIEHYGKSCKDILSKIICQPYFGRDIGNFSKNVNIYDYKTGYNKLTDKFSITIYEQQHSSPSFGMLVNNKLYYATDTIVCSETFKAANNTQLLLHECWTINGDETKHSSLLNILEVSKGYNIGRIGLIHLNPEWSNQEYSEVKELIKESNLFITNDGDEFNI